MSELEHANTVLAKAHEVLTKSEENLNKSIAANDLALVQHREMAYALSCLVHPVQTLTPMSEDEQEQLIKTLSEIPSQPLHLVPREPVLSNGRVIGFVDHADGKREMFDIVNAINVLAMANTDVLHVFTRFFGHVNELNVTANSCDSEYINSRPNTVFDESVYLDQEDALEKLLVIESQITELVIEAREEAEAKAEVEA